jgi:two-component system LytT family response regulator
MINCYVIGEFATVELLCSHINTHPHTELKGYSLQIPERFDLMYPSRPDILFIDAAMLCDADKWMDRARQFSSVVLVSGDTLKAFEAFEHLAFDYLITPVTFNRFVKCINKFDHLTQLAYSVHASKKQDVLDSFYIKTDSKGYKEVLVRCDQLIYIQALQNYVVLHLENDKRLACHNSMKEMEDSLSGSNFSRIHKSFIINDNKITSIEGNTVTLNHSENNKILVGSTYRKAFFEKKNQKMIKKQKLLPQLQSYSLLGSLVFYLALTIEESVTGLQVISDIFL